MSEMLIDDDAAEAPRHTKTARVVSFVSLNEVDVPTTPGKQSIVPSLPKAAQTNASILATRRLLVYSYAAICRKIKSGDAPSHKYMPDFVPPELMRLRLSEIDLCKLICDFRNLMEVVHYHSFRLFSPFGYLYLLFHLFILLSPYHSSSYHTNIHLVSSSLTTFLFPPTLNFLLLIQIHHRRYLGAEARTTRNTASQKSLRSSSKTSPSTGPST